MNNDKAINYLELNSYSKKNFLVFVFGLVLHSPKKLHEGAYFEQNWKQTTSKLAKNDLVHILFFSEVDFFLHCIYIIFLHRDEILNHAYNKKFAKF